MERHITFFSINEHKCMFLLFLWCRFKGIGELGCNGVFLFVVFNGPLLSLVLYPCLVSCCISQGLIKLL